MNTDDEDASFTDGSLWFTDKQRRATLEDTYDETGKRLGRSDKIDIFHIFCAFFLV